MELTQQQIEKIEEYIAFEGLVELLHWEDTSQWGFKVQLGLRSRADLDAFDKTMKRSKRRGGQRYHCILYGAGDHGVGETMREEVQMEALFCGRGWAETKGAHIALHVPDLDDQGFFRRCQTGDQSKETAGVVWNIMLLEVGDDEIIINQTTVDKVEALKGGPHSKAVAMLLQDEDFGSWFDLHSIHAKSGVDGLVQRTVKQRDALVKVVCGISSKVEFDHDEEAWQRWETQFHRPFIQYMQRREKKSRQ